MLIAWELRCVRNGPFMECEGHQSPNRRVKIPTSGNRRELWKMSQKPMSLSAGGFSTLRGMF